jgi:hypothetical protein
VDVFVVVFDVAADVDDLPFRLRRERLVKLARLDTSRAVDVSAASAFVDNEAR